MHGVSNVSTAAPSAYDCSGVPDGTTRIITILDVGGGAPYPVLCVGKYVLLAKIVGNNGTWGYNDLAWSSLANDVYPPPDPMRMDLTFRNMR